MATKKNGKPSDRKQQTRRIPRSDEPAPAKSRHREGPRSKKGGMPAFLEILLNFYVMVRSWVLSGIAKIRRFIHGHSSKGGGKNVYQFPSARKRLPIVIAAGVLLLCFVIYGAVWLLTNENAIVVYMNGQEIGTVAYDKELTDETIKNTAIAKLKSSLGDQNVQVSDTIMTAPVHANGTDQISMDELLARIYTGFTYKVEACAISVNGIEMAVVPSLADATEIQDTLKAAYDQENLNITDASFVEDVQNTLKFVEKEEIMTNEEASEILSKNLDAEVVYVVQPGDVSGSIAGGNGMTVDELVKLNPGLNPDFLQIGQELILNVPKPLLSVRTVERVTYQAVAEKTTENRENPEEYRTYTKVIQQGKNGQKEVTEDIIRINGIETEKIPVSEKILIEPITEIIEVGTSDIPPKRALGTFILPTRGRITDYFAARGGSHAGLDIANAYGTPVYASDGGTVTKADWYSGYGLIVIIDHGNGFETYYGHNSELLVTEGQQVAQGEQLAKMGSTGNSSGNHCHFEIHLNGAARDPLDYLS